MNLFKNFMRFFNGVILLLIVMNLTPSMAQQRYCGSVLRDALDALCVNGFNPMPLSKRSDTYTNLIDNHGPYKLNSLNSYEYGRKHDSDYDRDHDRDRDRATTDVDDENDDVVPHSYDNANFLYKIFNSDTANLITKTRRRRHGVYEECCRKPCYINELADYCL